MISRANRQKALVTGATGYVGSHLVRHLLAGGWQVDVIARTSSDLRVLGDARHRVTVHRYTGSVNSMMEILEKSRPDSVFHLASCFLPQHQPDDIPTLVQSNIQFGTELLEAMTAHQIYSFINAGTSWQHYKNRDYEPVCLYAATKQAFEDILAYYTAATPLRAITLKLFETYGPNDTRRKLIPLLLRAERTHEELDLSPGEQLLDFVHVSDVAEAFLIAHDNLLRNVGIGRPTYGISSGTRISLRSLVHLYEKARNVSLRIRWGARAYRTREVMSPWQTFERLPNWRPRIELSEGLRRIA